MDEPANILGSGLDYIDSPQKRVEKWLCKNKTVEQQNERQCKTPKRMLTVQLPIRLFNSSKQTLLFQITGNGNLTNEYN